MIQCVLVLCVGVTETVLRWLSDGSPVVILANMAVGLVAILIPVWWLRLRSGVPFTTVDRQLVQLFFLLTAAMLLLLAVVYIKGLTIRQVMGLDLVVIALGVGCGALVLGGSLYPLALGCAALSVVVAFYQEMPPVFIGLVVGGGLFYAGWGVARDPAAGAPG
jgi:hypothetical protein